MTKLLKKSFVFIFAFWLLLGQTGLAWKSATCVFTGNVKYVWGNHVSCCKNTNTAPRNVISRASCCAYDQFQVKLSAEQQLKLIAFEFVGVEPVATISFIFDSRIPLLSDFSFLSNDFSPHASVKRAIIQVYLI
jgi:hypothetical protein